MSETAADRMITFDRIGRSRGPHLALPIPGEIATDANRVAELVHAFARRHLSSSHFGVTVDLGTGIVLLEAGRYGVGQIHLMSETQAILEAGQP